MTTLEEKNSETSNKKGDLDTSPIEVLEGIRATGRVWDELCEQYGVDNPNPPWKESMDTTCDALAIEDCALPGVERRHEEDELSNELYADVPYPERTLLSLAHSLIKRGVLDEDELAQHMKKVDLRLNSC